MINKVRTYLLEEEFVINIYKNQINIVNYLKIIHFDFHKVIISHDDGLLTIIGSDLKVSKLLNKEILIKGEIQKIELG